MNLTKQQVELLLKSARASSSGGRDSASAEQVQPYDFQGSRQLSPEQVGRVVELHADFAKQLSRILTSITSCECKLSSVGGEQVALSNLFEQIPDSIVHQTLHLDSPEAKVLVQCDFTTVLAMIDLMLGGDGTPNVAPRVLTAVEQEMFEPIVRAVGEQLRAVWLRFVTADVQPAYYSEPANAAPPNEEIFALKFEVQVGGTQGTWVVIVPGLVSSALVLKMEEEISVTKAHLSTQYQERLKEKVLDSCFAMELLLPSSPVSVRKLAHLKRGHVIVLKPRSSDPIHVNVAGINLFHASPVSCGTRRGAQIRKVLSIARSENKEAG